MNTSAAAAAYDATVATMSNLSPDRVAAKLRAAVGYHERAAQEAEAAVVRVRDKAARLPEKLALLVAGLEAEVAAAEATQVQAAAELAAARAVLDHMSGGA